MKTPHPTEIVKPPSHLCCSVLCPNFDSFPTLPLTRKCHPVRPTQPEAQALDVAFVRGFRYSKDPVKTSSKHLSVDLACTASKRQQEAIDALEANSGDFFDMAWLFEGVFYRDCRHLTMFALSVTCGGISFLKVSGKSTKNQRPHHLLLKAETPTP